MIAQKILNVMTQIGPIIKDKTNEEKGFDYVALGHIHKKTINKNIVYPGSSIALGFDEIGEHGMMEVEIQKNKLDIKFIKLDETEFVEKDIDISDIYTEEELIEKINNEKIEEKKLYKIILTGNKNIEINKRKILKILNKKNILKIKDETKVQLDIKNISEQNNLKGYFIQELLKLKEEKDYSEEEIDNAIEIGLNSLL